MMGWIACHPSRKCKELKRCAWVRTFSQHPAVARSLQLARNNRSAVYSLPRLNELHNIMLYANATIVIFSPSPQSTILNPAAPQSTPSANALHLASTRSWGHKRSLLCVRVRPSVTEGQPASRDKFKVVRSGHSLYTVQAHPSDQASGEHYCKLQEDRPSCSREQ